MTFINCQLMTVRRPGRAPRAALAFVDGRVDELVRAVKRAGLESRTTYLVVSDHGFKAYRKQIKPNTALEAAGLGKQVYVLPEGGTAFVYIDKAQAAALTGKVREILSQVEGIDRVIGPEEYAQHGLPHPDKDPQFGELLLSAKDDYSFSGATGGPVTAAVPQTGGSHGYLASDKDMNPLFVVSGYGVKPGPLPRPVVNLDIAPTIAKLLGVSFPSAKGRPVL